MKIIKVSPNEIPMSLLLQADPSVSNINSYLPSSWCYAAKDQRDNIVAACVLNSLTNDVLELFNIAVQPCKQAKGIGSDMLRYIIQEAKSHNIKRIELGTGTFGYQLSFYQRLGFRVDAVIKNHFVNNYSAPIFENGIEHRDVLRLYLNL